MLYAEWNLDEYVAVQKADAERKAKFNTAKIALAKGLSLEDAAELADLPVAEIMVLV